jgi:hypothetical protein
MRFDEDPEARRYRHIPHGKVCNEAPKENAANVL